MGEAQARASLALIRAGLGAAGAAKLASAKFTLDNFARWGYPEPARFVIGAIEVGVAGAIAALPKRARSPRSERCAR